MASKKGVSDAGTVRLWLADTGCGHDLVSIREVGELKKLAFRAAKVMVFNTANGPVRATMVISFFVKEFQETIEPYLLKETPAVLSIGFRTMQLGYSFLWPAGERPYFLLPSGLVAY